MPAPLRCAASAPVHGRIEPVGDDLRHLVAVLFQHHHVSVTVDAKVGELDKAHTQAEASFYAGYNHCNVEYLRQAGVEMAPTPEWTMDALPGFAFNHAIKSVKLPLLGRRPGGRSPGFLHSAARSSGG